MILGISGLGLIGASLAKAYKRAEQLVYGYDADETVLGYAKMSGTVDGTLDSVTIADCDVFFLALYPAAVLSWLRENAPHIRKDAIVIDCAGVKTAVCPEAFAIASQYGFHFLGGHPMAGTQFSGIKYAKADMFDGATMILVPPAGEDLHLLQKVKSILQLAGFSSVTVTSAEIHDRNIAFTSQLAHVVSNAYVKSPNARVHHGFSAGSYRDLTRVAKLNAPMWTELFLDNRENLVSELDSIIHALDAYRDALREQDASRLQALLEEGSRTKEEIDAEWKQ